MLDCSPRVVICMTSSNIFCPWVKLSLLAKAKRIKFLKLDF
jgi:hypothetical protein